jgi:TM2 domain-containing membrane protein YozV
MEFEKDQIVSDDERRLAEAKQVIITPLHSDVTPEAVPTAELDARALTPPQPNVTIDNEQTDAEHTIQPTKSALNTQTEAVSPRHFLAVFFFSFFWGTWGVDRFYIGKIGTGLLKLLTFGGLGVWTLVDLVIILSGTMRDKQGRLLAGFAEFKKLAITTTLISAAIIGAVILISGIMSIVALTNLYNDYQNGKLSIPGIDNSHPLQLPTVNTL